MLTEKIQKNNKVDARYRKKERKNCLLSFHSNKCGIIKFVSCVALSVRVVEPTEGRTIIEHKLCSSFVWVWFYRLARQMFWLFAGELYCCITNGERSNVLCACVIEIYAGDPAKDSGKVIKKVRILHKIIQKYFFYSF